MQIHNASATGQDGSFLHIGYLSAGRPHYRETPEDTATYSALSAALVATRAKLDPDGTITAADTASADPGGGGTGNPAATAALVEPGWQAPAEYASLYGLVIDVNSALAVDRPAFSPAAARTIAPVARTTRAPLHPPSTWQLFQEATSFYLPAILLCCAGIVLLAVARRKTARIRFPALVIIAATLLCCVIAPAARSYAAARDARNQPRVAFVANPPQTGSPGNQTYSLTGAVVDPAPAEPLKYRHPAEATMMLMHGLIGPWLRSINQPLPTLYLMEEQAATLDGNIAVPIPNLAVNNCTHDGWGREFRYQLLDITYSSDGNSVNAWRYLLQSAGADGRFDTADDFRHIRRLAYWDGGEDGLSTPPPYYGVFVYTAFERDPMQDYLVFMPRISNQPQRVLPGRTTFTRQHFSRGFRPISDELQENTIGEMLIDDHTNPPGRELTLQLYALGAEDRL